MNIFTKSYDDIARIFCNEPDDETIAVPADLAPLQDTGRLRLLNGAVIDIAAHDGPFYIDPADPLLLLHVVPSIDRIEIRCNWNATLLLVNGVVEQHSPASELKLLKERLKAVIDQAAERQRLRYITAGAGQAMTYAQKAEEARLCLDATEPDPEDYPLLAAEIGITANTLVGVAQVVATANAQWLQIGRTIEAARLSAKKAVSEAETAENAQAAADAVVWP